MAEYLLFTSQNVKELADIIRKASNLSDEEYLTMSDNAIKFAHNDMSKESYYARLIPFYKRVMNIYRQTNSIWDGICSIIFFE